MQYPNRNIELGPRQYGPNQVRNFGLGLQNPNYLAQVDEDTDPEDPQLPIEPYQTPHYSSCYKFWRNRAVNLPILVIFCMSILDFAPILVGLLTFVTNIPHYQALLFGNSNVLQYISDDLSADPIMEIQIMDERSTCPSDFQILKLGTWPGTVAGCLCEDGELWATHCENVNSAKCKKSILWSSPIEMYEWDDSIWCVKRARLGVDYLRKAVCPPGYKQCYAGGCFMGDCPITKAEITSTETANKFNNAKDKYLALTRRQGELPLINIQMTFGDLPCFIQDLFAQTIKNSTYGLSAIKEKNCDKYGLDTHFSTRIASQPAYDSFTQNSFPESFMNLPYFESDANTTTSILSSKVRMKTAQHDSCQSINDEALNSFLEAFLAPDIICFAFFFSLLILRLMDMFNIIDYRTKSQDIQFFEKAPDLMKTLYQLHSFALFCVIVILVSFKYTYPSFKAAKDYFEEYETLGCFDGGQGSMVVNEYLGHLRVFEKSFWIYSVLFVSSLLSTLMCFWLYIVNNKLPRYIL